jgi:hypothetical protein
MVQTKINLRAEQKKFRTDSMPLITMTEWNSGTKSHIMKRIVSFANIACGRHSSSIIVHPSPPFIVISKILFAARRGLWNYFSFYMSGSADPRYQRK